jgi:hypothetical protein
MWVHVYYHDIDAGLMVASSSSLLFTRFPATRPGHPGTSWLSTWASVKSDGALRCHTDSANQADRHHVLLCSGLTAPGPDIALALRRMIPFSVQKR